MKRHAGGGRDGGAKRCRRESSPAAGAAASAGATEHADPPGTAVTAAPSAIVAGVSTDGSSMCEPPSPRRALDVFADRGRHALQTQRARALGHLALLMRRPVSAASARELLRTGLQLGAAAAAEGLLEAATAAVPAEADVPAEAELD